MKIITPHNKCTGCHACFSACPTNAISICRDYAGFLYPTINQELCVDCNLCVRICPINKIARSDTNNSALPKAFACINADGLIRYESSSGGAFTAFAEEILSNGGVVFGARFDPEFNVVHDYTETIEGLSKFRGSKYVESSIGLTLKIAKQFLQEGRLVLFSGTPCQIEGLLSFLGKEYQNLITIDLICHGVPSPMIWAKYIRYRNKQYKSTPERVSFRDKRLGWKLFSLSIEYQNMRKYSKSLNDDLYMQLFLNNVCLRESCYKCKFKVLHRKSDITIADFWGIERKNPELFDNRGTSLLLIHSSKGYELTKLISNKVHLVDMDLGEAISNNMNAIKSAQKPIGRIWLPRYISYHNFTLVGIMLRNFKLAKRFKSKAIDIFQRLMKANN
jgi:coenzyme F420-reducing hydrogenase beta subunit